MDMTCYKGLQHWVKTHPVLAFPLVYLGWAYLFWAPVLLWGTSVWAVPDLLWFLMGGASPLIAAVSLAAISGGKARLREIFARLVNWRRISARWWTTVLLFWLGFYMLMAGIAYALDLISSPVDIHWTLWSQPGPLLFLLLLSFVFPAVEELVLRGFYLEELRKRLSPCAAAIANGVVWACWHAPFVALPGYYANTNFHPQLWWWIPMIVGHTVLIVHVYLSTGQSLLAVLLFHGMMNFTGEWLRLAPQMQPLMLLPLLLLAWFVMLNWKKAALAGP